MEGNFQSFSDEKNSKLDTSKISSNPKFEDIVEIKNYYNKSDSTTENNFSDIYNNNYKFCVKKIGHTICFFSDKMGNPKIMIGPHFPLYVAFCGGVTIGYIFFNINFWQNFNYFVKFLAIFTYFFYFISYSGTALLNPGYPERNEESISGKSRRLYKYCEECKIWVRIDRKIVHCRECGICIEGYDHHCPWTGKCIGRKTVIYFYLFLFAVVSIFLYFIIALVYTDLNEGKKKHK